MSHTFLGLCACVDERQTVLVRFMTSQLQMNVQSNCGSMTRLTQSRIRPGIITLTLIKRSAHLRSLNTLLDVIDSRVVGRKLDWGREGEVERFGLGALDLLRGCV